MSVKIEPWAKDLLRLACPPPCLNGKQCDEEVLCAPDTCPHKQKSWRHTAECIHHICAHDFKSGPTVYMGNGSSASCACGMTAFGHDMRYAP